MNLSSKHSLDTKISLEEEESKRLKDEMSKLFDYSKHPRMLYIVKEDEMPRCDCYH